MDWIRDHLWETWLGLSIVLGVAEMFSLDLILAMLAAGAVVGMVAAIIGLPVVVQILAPAAAFVLAGGAVGTGEAGQPTPSEIVQVAPGDTLWGIASEIATDGDVRGVMNEIERLNALESTGVAAGQKLRVPVLTD